MAAAFHLEMRLDENGVVLCTTRGVFDVRKWAETYATARAKFFAGPADQDRPMVWDLRDFIPPPDDWIGDTKDIFARLGEFGETAGRRAAITGDNREAAMAVRFYVEFKKAVHDRGGEVRIFEDFDEGYAWAIKGWQASPGGPGPAD